MRTVIIRTAYSHMIIEGHDFSSAVLTPAGELVAASQIEQPTHISALSWSAREVLARYRDDIGPGDLYLHNDPYTGGSHLNDVGLFYPVFHHDRPLAIVAVMAHWQDIGGMVPGSLCGNATEIYQEGIRIPSLRIVRRGVAIEEVLDLLFANVRGPDDRRGDLRAMEGACRIAERHLHAMADQWGERTIRETLGALLDRAERRMRDGVPGALLRALDRGRVHGGDGGGARPRRGRRSGLDGRAGAVLVGLRPGARGGRGAGACGGGRGDRGAARGLDLRRGRGRAPRTRRMRNAAGSASPSCSGEGRALRADRTSREIRNGIRRQRRGCGRFRRAHWVERPEKPCG